MGPTFTQNKKRKDALTLSTPTPNPDPNPTLNLTLTLTQRVRIITTLAGQWCTTRGSYSPSVRSTDTCRSLFTKGPSSLVYSWKIGFPRTRNTLISILHPTIPHT